MFLALIIIHSSLTYDIYHVKQQLRQQYKPQRYIAPMLLVFFLSICDEMWESAPNKVHSAHSARQGGLSSPPPKTTQTNTLRPFLQRRMVAQNPKLLYFTQHAKLLYFAQHAHVSIWVNDVRSSQDLIFLPYCLCSTGLDLLGGSRLVLGSMYSLL